MSGRLYTIMGLNPSPHQWQDVWFHVIFVAGFWEALAFQQWREYATGKPTMMR